MLRRSQREVYRYFILAKAKAEHAKPPAMVDLVNAWRSARSHANALIERDSGSIIYRVGDVTISNSTNTAILHLRRGDEHASNVVFSNKLTGKSRVEKKNDDEVGDRTAHLVISLKEESGKANKYLAHLEGVPGISHRVIQPLLNQLTRVAVEQGFAKFTFDDPLGATDDNNEVKKHAFFPTVEMLGQQYQGLKNDIKNGTISEIELVDLTPKKNLGSSGYLKEETSTLMVSVDKSIPSKGRLGLLKKAFATKNSQYQRAIVRFVDPDGKSRTAKFDTATGSPEQLRYISSYEIMAIKPALHDASEKPVKRVWSRMQGHLVHERT